MSIKNGHTRLPTANPLYCQVRDMVLLRIKNGEWKSGDTLPNEYVLATQFGVSIGTIRRALEGLEEAGLVVRKQGRGTYVSGLSASEVERKFCPLLPTGDNQLDLRYKVLHLARRRASGEERTALSGMISEDVLDICMLVLDRGRPIGIEKSILAGESFSKIDEVISDQNLYATLSSHGVLLFEMDDIISVEVAEDNLIKLLELQPGAPVIRIERTTKDYAGDIVEFRVANYNARSVRYAASITVSGARLAP